MSNDLKIHASVVPSPADAATGRETETYTSPATSQTLAARLSDLAEATGHMFARGATVVIVIGPAGKDVRVQVSEFDGGAERKLN